jgi:hypothetical protein
MGLRQKSIGRFPGNHEGKFQKSAVLLEMRQTSRTRMVCDHSSAAAQEISLLILRREIIIKYRVIRSAISRHISNVASNEKRGVASI